MRLLELQGTPYERGVSYGEQARDEIVECVAVYQRWFAEFAGLTWDAARQLGAPYRRWLESADPALADEMRGIADGAQLRLDDVIALNFRTEIAYGASGLMGTTECTSFGISGEGSASGHVYVAENWDWLEATLPLVVMLDITLGEDDRLVTVTEAGMVAKFGMNSHGVGLCVNLLGSDVNGVGASFHTMARKVLESRSALEAVWSASGVQRAGSGNFVIGSAAGEVLDLEYNPAGYALHFPHDGFVAHTNHFLQAQPGLRDRLQLLPNVSPGSYFRQARIEELLSREADQGGVTVDGMKAVLADHYGNPEGICRHGGPVGPQRVLGRTNVSAIMDLTDSVMYLAHGHACDTEYDTVVLPWSQLSSEPLAGR